MTRIFYVHQHRELTMEKKILLLLKPVTFGSHVFHSTTELSMLHLTGIKFTSEHVPFSKYSVSFVGLTTLRKLENNSQNRHSPHHHFHSKNRTTYYLALSWGTGNLKWFGEFWPYQGSCYNKWYEKIWSNNWFSCKKLAITTVNYQSKTKRYSNVVPKIATVSYSNTVKCKTISKPFVSCDLLSYNKHRQYLLILASDFKYDRNHTTALWQCKILLC